MDWGVGEIMAALDRLDITDNTIVYFTSDHGGHVEEMVNSNGGYNGIYRGRNSRLLQNVLRHVLFPLTITISNVMLTHI